MTFFKLLLFVAICAVSETADEVELKSVLNFTDQEIVGNNPFKERIDGVSPMVVSAKECSLPIKDGQIKFVDNSEILQSYISHPKFKSDILVQNIIYQVVISTNKHPVEIMVLTVLDNGDHVGRFLNKTVIKNCGPSVIRTVVTEYLYIVSWTSDKLSQPSTNVSFKIYYKLENQRQIYLSEFKKSITRDCNLWLSSEKSELSSEDINPIGECQIWLMNEQIRKGVVVELSRLNVPCSRGYLLFSGIENNYPRKKRQRKLCGKIEEVPSTERNIYFSPSPSPAFLYIQGSPIFSLTYGLVDQCYNLTFLTKNGSYHLYSTPELECTLKIHLPYGNRIILKLESGSITNEPCEGILSVVTDGINSWNYCIVSLEDGQRSTEIVSSENKLEIKLSSKSNGLQFRMSYVAQSIENIVGNCQFGWISLHHMCVTVVETNKMTWLQAEEQCVKWGGHLASITNDFTESVIENFILNSPGYQEQNAFWIGANDKAHEGNFQWSDSSPFSYANWFPGWPHYNYYNRQPNDDGLSEQDCIEIRKVFSIPNGGYQVTSFMWNDRDCSTLNYFICEKFQKEGSVVDPWKTDCNKSVILTQQHPIAVITSPGFPRPYPDNIECITEISAPSAYRILLDFEELVLEDEPSCSYDYLEIIEPTVSNAAVNDTAVNGVTTDVKKGTRRLCGDWSSKLKLLRHSSSESKIILHFSTDYSHHYGGFKARFSMRNAKQCHDDRLQFFQNSCYLVVSYPEVSWSTANHICEGIKSQLASILSPEEEKFIGTNIRRNPEHRVGALYWLGAKEDDDGRFIWTDTNPMVYSNWFPNTHIPHQNKNSTEKRLHCLSIQWTPSQIPSHPSGLYWRSHKCNATGGYVCKRPREDLTISVNFNKTVNGTQGRISTPNFPESYKSDFEFSIKIIGPSRSRIVIEFEKIDLEYQPACLYDYVELVGLRNGAEDSETSAKLCGTYDTDMSRFNYFSVGPEMKVNFHSDYSVAGSGFSLKWRAVDVSACPSQTLTSNEGIIMTPNFPFSLLPNLNCSVIVMSPSKKRVWLEFLDFDINDDILSKNSLLPTQSTIVEIDLGEELTVLHPYQSEHLLTDGAFVSNAEALKIHFKTNESPSGKGFKARYKIVDYLEQKRVISLRPEISGFLKHLNYPAPPATDIDFLQHLIAPVGYVIHLELYNVKLRETECSDRRGLIEIHDMYADTNGTSWNLCFEDTASKSPMAITSYVNTLCFRQKSGPLGFPFNGSLQVYNDSHYKEKLRKHHHSPVGFCEPNPCVNNGKCVNNGNKRFCQCNGQFAGLFCGITKCELNPCFFGTCELTLNHYKCLCDQGYSGLTCELKQKPCESNPCENRGICIEKGNNFHCQCHAWWEGVRCDKRMLHIPYKPLSQRMLQEPFWLGLITVTVVMGVIGLFWCAKRHFPEKIEKLLAEESERNRSNLPSLRTSLRDQLAASSASTVTVIPSPSSGNPRTLLGRFGIRKPSILSLTSPRQIGYSPATARTFSLDDLLKPTRLTPSPRKRNNSTPSKKSNAEKKQILQQLMTPTGTQQPSKDSIQMSERKTYTKTESEITEVKETKLSASSGNVSDPKLEKKVTFARLLNKISSEMSSASDVEMGILKSGKIASAFTRSSSTPPSPATEMRSANSNSSNQGSDSFSSSDLAIPSLLNDNMTDFLNSRRETNFSCNRQKPSSADSILAMFRNFSSTSSCNRPTSLKPSPSTTPSMSSPLEDYAIEDDSSSINTPISYGSMTFDSPLMQNKPSGTIDVPVLDALSAQKCSSGISGSNLLHPPTILLEIPSTINKCLSPIREMPTPLPSPMPSPAITPIMHRSKASSLNNISVDSSEDKISIDIPDVNNSDVTDLRCNSDIVIDPQGEDGLILEEAAALQKQTRKMSESINQLDVVSSSTSRSSKKIHPLVIPTLTIQMPSPTRNLRPHLVIGSPPPQKLPFINIEKCSESSPSFSSRKSLNEMDKPSSLDLVCTPPVITITCNLSEAESDAESTSPAIKKAHLGPGTTTMCYLSPFGLGQRNDRTTSESNLSSSGYSSMASPGSSRCGSNNPLCPSEMDDPSCHTYHPLLGLKSSRRKSIPPAENFQKATNSIVRERSDSETFSDDVLMESNDEGIGTDHIEEKIEDGEVKSAKELEVFITSDCDGTKTLLKVPSITNINSQCCVSVESNKDLLMPPSTKNSLCLPSIIIQNDSIGEKYLSPVSSRSESPLSDKTIGIERFSPQFYGRNKDLLPFTDSDGLYDFPSIDKMNISSSSQPCRKYMTRRKEKRATRSFKLPSPNRTTNSSPIQNLDVPRKDSIYYRPHPTLRKSSPKRKLRGQQILSSSSSSESMMSKNCMFSAPVSMPEDIRWSYSNEEWSDSKNQRTSDEEAKEGAVKLRSYPRSSEDVSKPKRINKLRTISHQIRFLRRLQQSLRRKERTISPSDSFESEEDSSKVTSPLIQSSDKLHVEIRKSKSINFNQPLVRNRRYKRDDLLVKDEINCKRVFITDNGYSD